jgi:hypothetical protein
LCTHPLDHHRTSPFVYFVNPARSLGTELQIGNSSATTGKLCGSLGCRQWRASGECSFFEVEVDADVEVGG